MGLQGSSLFTLVESTGAWPPGLGTVRGREGCCVRGDKTWREGGLAQEVWSHISFTVEQKSVGASKWFARRPCPGWCGCEHSPCLLDFQHLKVK